MRARGKKNQPIETVISSDEEDDSDPNKVYFVDAIEGSRLSPSGVLEYYVKWENDGNPVHTWEPAENFTRLNDFKEERKKYSSSWSSKFRREFKEFVWRKYVLCQKSAD